MLRGRDNLPFGTQEGSGARRFYQRPGWRQLGLTKDGEVFFSKGSADQAEQAAKD